jgi:hypothetical protein
VEFLGKKLLQDQEQLRPMMGWVDSVPLPLVRLIGALAAVAVWLGTGWL